MTKGIKIVTIGGGSSYTPELVEGIIKRYEELPVRELWLVDIPEGEKKLNIVGTLAKRMVEKAGVPIEIHLTLDRREALKDADFVTTQFRVGLLEARAKDERIPLKYGVIGQETNGPGGLFKGSHHPDYSGNRERHRRALSECMAREFHKPCRHGYRGLAPLLESHKSRRPLQCADRH